MAKSPSIRTYQFPPYHPISLTTPHAFPQDCPVTPKGVLMTILEARAASTYISTQPTLFVVTPEDSRPVAV